MGVNMADLNLTPQETRKWAPYILIIMMIFVIGGFSWLWNNERNARIKLQNDASAGRTIDGIEQPGQAEVKQREAVNDSIDQQIAEGNTRLNAMYNVEKEIRNRRNKNVSKKDDLTSLGRELAAMGITNTVILGDTTSKTFRGYSTQTAGSKKVK
jgi:hypothetical protein